MNHRAKTKTATRPTGGSSNNPLGLNWNQRRELSEIMSKVCKTLNINRGELHDAIAKALRE